MSNVVKEKEEIEVKLAHTTQVTSNVGQQRRVRVKELERQLSDLQRSINEKNRMIRMNEQKQKDMMKINNEIADLKRTRVELHKKLKAENLLHQKYKQRKEKEVKQLEVRVQTMTRILLRTTYYTVQTKNLVYYLFMTNRRINVQ